MGEFTSGAAASYWNLEIEVSSFISQRIERKGLKSGLNF